MSGFVTKNGKYIMPLQDKSSYHNSYDLCDSIGFTNNLFENEKSHFLSQLHLTLIVEILVISSKMIHEIKPRKRFR